MAIKALLWDMDGVIIDSENYYTNITTQLFTQLGYDFDINIKPQLSGKNIKEVMKILVTHHKMDMTPDELYDKRTPLIQQMYEKDVKYTQGFETFYDKLQSKHHLPSAIVTGLDKTLVNVVGARLGFEKRFGKHIYSTEETPRHKPAPDGYLHAAKKLDVDPHDCLVFEDAPMGIIAALRAGAIVVAVTSTFTKKQIKDTIAAFEVAHKEDIIYIEGFNEETLKKIEQLIA